MAPDIRFQAAEQVPDALYERVLTRVSTARVRAARVRTAVSSFFLAASGIGSFVAVRATIDAANASGFTSFASLALTDTGVTAAHAQAFALSLIETLPSVQVACVLFALSVALVSLRGLAHALVHTPVRSLHAHA